MSERKLAGNMFDLLCVNRRSTCIMTDAHSIWTLFHNTRAYNNILHQLMPLCLDRSHYYCWYCFTVCWGASPCSRIHHGWFHTAKKICSLVLKVKKWAALFFRVLTGIYNTVYRSASALFKKCTRYSFQRNRSFRGQPSGWNRLIVVMCTFTRILTYKPTK